MRLALLLILFMAMFIHPMVYRQKNFRLRDPNFSFPCQRVIHLLSNGKLPVLYRQILIK